MGQDQFTKLFVSGRVVELQESDDDLEEAEDRFVKLFGRGLIFQQQSDDSGDFTEEVLHLSVRGRELIDCHDGLLIIIIASELEHAFNLDGVLHVVDESSDGTRLHLRGLTSEADE